RMRDASLVTAACTPSKSSETPTQSLRARSTTWGSTLITGPPVGPLTRSPSARRRCGGWTRSLLPLDDVIDLGVSRGAVEDARHLQELRSGDALGLEVRPRERVALVGSCGITEEGVEAAFFDAELLSVASQQSRHLLEGQ